MRLSEYLEKHEITQKAFAEKIGVTQGRISQLIIDGKLTSLERALDLIERIERATGGKVTSKDWLRRRAA